MTTLAAGFDDALSRHDESTGAATPLLMMRRITKRFPGVVANDNVSFDVQAGEVHTLLGENGAGKSTLMKILYGLYQPDEGEVLLHGKPIRLTSPADAINHRIGMIHQHFMLVPTLTVAENVALGLKTSGGPITRLAEVKKRIKSLSTRYGLKVDPDALVWQLSVGERQRVEIIKALYRDVELLVLDEPTAVLTPSEVTEFFGILRDMKADGRGLIFISHKLNEVLELSDRITVLRHGKLVGDTTPNDTNREDLARMMVGREINSERAPREQLIDAPAILSIEGLSAKGDRGVDALVDVDLTVHAGEILGIAGVSGNGQRELAECITGLRPSRGQIVVDGQSLSGLSPRAVREAGVAFVPEERMRDGAIGEFSVTENLVLHTHRQARFSRQGLLRFSSIREHGKRLVESYRVKTPGLDTPTQNLSGGNIQKLIMARELDTEPRLLIAAQPTRGVDIGAAEYIHERLEERRAAGTAIMVISEDLDEILLLADRIAVILEGRVMGIVDRAATDRQQLGLLMAGVQAAASMPE